MPIEDAELSDIARPRKRARSETNMHADDTKQSPMDVHRDPDYYFEDGSAVILVQNVLFKVHRTILSRDSSAFETLFRLPSGKQAVEGTRDSDPVILQGDTPEQFRSLLWSLYSL
ncbi:hypothetical protein M422DRAFT_784864 [Sphaerobolus stellatus SS14]|uniref:BTB domain-containing protein n=1 Tax=Sphaerobolus stellatus (strain SS14) TaxID=990650 RepID=A0A0C9UQ13_SPHS4|nr:hypothetical protein M422DRAFT_784864 [Sphaerobolus stellatus SS14]